MEGGSHADPRPSPSLHTALACILFSVPHVDACLPPRCPCDSELAVEAALSTLHSLCVADAHYLDRLAAREPIRVVALGLHAFGNERWSLAVQGARLLGLLLIRGAQSKASLRALGLHRALREWVHTFYHRTDVIEELLLLLEHLDDEGVYAPPSTVDFL